MHIIIVVKTDLINSYLSYLIVSDMTPLELLPQYTFSEIDNLMKSLEDKTVANTGKNMFFFVVV